MQRARKKNAASQFDGLGFAENVDVSGILPDAVFPNGTRDERDVMAGNDVNWTRKRAKAFADFANEEAVHRVVLEHVASKHDHFGPIVPGGLDPPFRRLQPFLSDALGHAADRFGFHPNLPIGGVEEFHWLALSVQKALLHNEADFAGMAALDDLIQISVIRPSPGAGGIGAYPGKEGRQR